jgi:hypothetical protein
VSFNQTKESLKGLGSQEDFAAVEQQLSVCDVEKEVAETVSPRKTAFQGNSGLIWQFTPDGTGACFAGVGEAMIGGLALDANGDLLDLVAMFRVCSVYAHEDNQCRAGRLHQIEAGSQEPTGVVFLRHSSGRLAGRMPHGSSAERGPAGENENRRGLARPGCPRPPGCCTEEPSQVEVRLVNDHDLRYHVSH